MYIHQRVRIWIDIKEYSLCWSISHFMKLLPVVDVRQMDAGVRLQTVIEIKPQW